MQRSWSVTGFVSQICVTHTFHTLQAAAQVVDVFFQLSHATKAKQPLKVSEKPVSEAAAGPGHLLDFGCLRDGLQVLLEHQDFGVFLLQDGDQVVQQSDVSAGRDPKEACFQLHLIPHGHDHRLSGVPTCRCSIWYRRSC